jgi:hypothetical protein
MIINRRERGETLGTEKLIAGVLEFENQTRNDE